MHLRLCLLSRNSWNCALTSLSLIVCRNSWNALTSLSFVCRNSWNCALTPHLYVCLLSVEILGTVHLCLCLLSVEILGTVDFVHSDGTVVFRTCAEEKEKVVFQMVRSVLILLFFFVWGNQGWWPFRVNSGAKELNFFFFFDAEKEFLQSKYQGATQVQCMLS